jgi:hypothetical protein
MDFQNLPQKKEYFAQELAPFAQKRASLADDFFISPYFILKNKDLKHGLRLQNKDL